MYQKYYEGDLIKKAKKLSTINKAAEKYGVEFVPKILILFMIRKVEWQILNVHYLMTFVIMDM